MIFYSTRLVSKVIGPIGQKKLILHEFLMARKNSRPMGQKDGNFFVLIKARANGNIFRVKNHTSP